MSRESAQLRALIEVMQQITEEAKKEKDAERRSLSGMLHSLDAITERLDNLPPLIKRIESALARVETGRLLGTVEMADRVGMHPDTLRRRAEQGQLPAYQTVAAGNWYYDPAEVVRALTETRKPYTDEAGDRAAEQATGSTYDEWRDSRNEAAHREQINKEMEATQ